MLVVAYYFPPILTSGALRPAAFCRYLRKYGWLPRVLTVDPNSVNPPMEIDETLSRNLPADLQIDHAAHAKPIKAFIWFRDRLQCMVPGQGVITSTSETITPTARKQKDIDLFTRTRTKWNDLMLDWLLTFPESQSYWKQPAIRKLRDLPVHERPMVVYATGGPWTSLLVGEQLARQWRVPFVADFRDPCSRNPNLEERSPVLIKKIKSLEERVCQSAAAVITNTIELQNSFSEDYPYLRDKFITITNGFDQHSVSYVNKASNLTSSSVGLELCHFGTVYGGRNPLELFRAIKEISTESRCEPEQLRLRFVGLWEVDDDRVEALAQELEKRGYLRRDPPVPHKVCLQQMSEAQVLLVIQDGYPLQIPGKIYEYIATGRPLLIIGGTGATSHLVECHGLGKCCLNRAQEIKRLFLSLLEKRESFQAPTQQQVEPFDYSTLTGELAHLFDRVCRDNCKTS